MANWWTWESKCSLILEAKDVLPNINRTQAAERAEEYRFCPWWPWPFTFTLTFKLVRARDLTRLPCEFGANPFSSSQDISYIKSHRQRQKQNLTQFTACGKMAICSVLQLNLHWVMTRLRTAGHLADSSRWTRQSQTSDFAPSLSLLSNFEYTPYWRCLYLAYKHE